MDACAVTRRPPRRRFRHRFPLALPRTSSTTCQSLHSCPPFSCCHLAPARPLIDFYLCPKRKLSSALMRVLVAVLDSSSANSVSLGTRGGTRGEMHLWQRAVAAVGGISGFSGLVLYSGTKTRRRHRLRHYESADHLLFLPSSKFSSPE